MTYLVFIKTGTNPTDPTETKMQIEANLAATEARTIYGVRGMQSKSFSRRFANEKAMDKWLESDAAADVTVERIER